jgi:hypothetical protein
MTVIVEITTTQKHDSKTKQITSKITLSTGAKEKTIHCPVDEIDLAMIITTNMLSQWRKCIEQNITDKKIRITFEDDIISIREDDLATPRSGVAE